MQKVQVQTGDGRSMCLSTPPFRKPFMYLPSIAIRIVNSTLRPHSASAEHVFRFRHTCSAESLGHAMAKLPIAGRELIIQDEPSRS